MMNGWIQSTIIGKINDMKISLDFTKRKLIELSDRISDLKKDRKALLDVYIRDNFSGESITKFLADFGFETYDIVPGQRVLFMEYKHIKDFKICIRESFNDDNSFEINLVE